MILCLVVFDQKATVLERFSSVQSEPMILGGGDFFSPTPNFFLLGQVTRDEADQNFFGTTQHPKNSTSLVN